MHHMGGSQNSTELRIRAKSSYPGWGKAEAVAPKKGLEGWEKLQQSEAAA